MMPHQIDTCAQCLQQLPVFNQCHSAWNYEFPVNHLIQKVKYQKQLAFLAPLAKQLARVLLHKYDNTPWPEAIIPVPLHKRRLRNRGFDQSLLLARALIRALRREAENVPPLQLDYRLIKRVKHTKTQQGLKADERRKNIKDAFTLRDGATKYRHVAILDDVVTTGETVSELTRLLKKQGTETVDIWCLARTPP